MLLKFTLFRLAAQVLHHYNTSFHIKAFPRKWFLCGLNQVTFHLVWTVGNHAWYCLAMWLLILEFTPLLLASRALQLAFACLAGPVGCKIFSISPVSTAHTWVLTPVTWGISSWIICGKHLKYCSIGLGPDLCYNHNVSNCAQLVNGLRRKMFLTFFFS